MLSDDASLGSSIHAPGDARFVWLPGKKPSRNSFVLFERRFHLDAVPDRFPLHLFADTRYRLRINGRFAGSGPARFVTSHPEFDSLDLSPLLQAGENVLSVEVNFYGASSFQTMPDGRPGFVAWGGSNGISLATPGEWVAAELERWRHDAPLFSFAQGPVEICDTRVPHPVAFVSPVVLPEKDCPWGPLLPYSGRPFRSEIQRPARIEVAGALRPPERIVGVMLHDPNLQRGAVVRSPKRFAGLAIWLRSTVSRRVRISCFWGNLWLNGEPLEQDAYDNETRMGNHQHATLDLQEGWNLLTASFEVLTEYWAWLIGIPTDAGISPHGLPDAACAFPIAVREALSPDPPTLPQPGEFALPEGWVLQDGRPPNLTPARLCAWDELAQTACKGMPAARLPEMSPIEAEAATWSLKFDGEFLGHVEVEVEAPAGSVLDVAFDDWQTPQGMLALYQSNPFTDAAERFILSGGRQRVELFSVRGGKFLQVTLRAPEVAAPLYLHDVLVRSRQTPGPSEAWVRSGSGIMDWAFLAARTTLDSSTSAAYADCPWRERGMYVGDGLVNMHLDFVFHNDPRTARRMIRQFAQARFASGMLPACAPAWLPQTFGDYTLIWIIALHDFWKMTGDRAVVDEVWPVLEGIWRSPAWSRGEDGLWDAGERDLFIDWGVLRSERQGPCNASLNAFRVGALRASAVLADLRGDDAAASVFRAEAEDVEEALFSRLWMRDEGRLAAGFGQDTPALHANVLALYFRLGDPARRKAMLRYLEPFVIDNLDRGLANGQFSGHLELYFFHFLLPALAAEGRPDLAELVIDRHYGYLHSLGDDTLPECFCRVQKAVGSRCHSWSGAGAIYAARNVLGIKFAEPGNPRRILFQPDVYGISAASGRIAHPDGWIEVSWRRLPDGTLETQLSAPEGVEIVTDPGVAREQPGKHAQAVSL